MKNINKLSSFWLKIIAMVTMTFDHLGIIYASFWSANPLADPFYVTCRYIGRFALPLYCFLLVEAVIHTKNYKKYNIKLGIMAGIISIGLALAQFVPAFSSFNVADAGNIFLDLLLGSVMIYCLKHENKYIKPLALLPLGYAILSFVVKGVERASCPTCYTALSITWFPGFLRLQYDWLSLAFMLGYFLSYNAAKLVYKAREEELGISADAMVGTNEWRITVNLFALLTTIVVSIAYYLFDYIAPDIVFWVPRIQLFAMAAGILLVLYSGKRGYNAKWFNNFAYVYYLVHIAVLFGVCYLIYIV